nr:MULTISPECIES: DNA polymerase Y family protein [unclassified Frankia]
MTSAPKMRVLAVCCPDWPLVAAGVAADVPAVVVAANQVLACTQAARSFGVRPGLRRREAQARCPSLVVLPDDPGRDARVFEPVIAAVESVVPGVEVVRPGECVVASGGATRYFGGDAAVARAVHGAVSGAGGLACGVGVADGPFVAVLAAHRNVIVKPDASRDFLASLPVETLRRPELADLLRRLGLPTLGHFAALPPDDVIARFGPDGAFAHRLARGQDHRPLAPCHMPPDLAVSTEVDPPADRVEFVVFAVRRLAEQVHDRLVTAGLACTRIVVEAQTEHGEWTRRVWRHDGPLSAVAIAERVRWQLEGWLSGGVGCAEATGGVAPSAGIVLIRIVPDQLVRADGRQLGLWGEAGVGADRVARAISRVQGMLGPDAVVTAVLGGGRGPAERVRLVPWGEPRAPAGVDLPWPGRLPAPAPATVPSRPVPAVVVDDAGAAVGVSGRCVVTAAPAWLAVDGRPQVRVTAWAGPWPADERWWDPAARRRARFQVTVADGSAHLLALENSRWWVEATYD